MDRARTMTRASRYLSDEPLEALGAVDGVVLLLVDVEALVVLDSVFVSLFEPPLFGDEE